MRRVVCTPLRPPRRCWHTAARSALSNGDRVVADPQSVRQTDARPVERWRRASRSMRRGSYKRKRNAHIAARQIERGVWRKQIERWPHADGIQLVASRCCPVEWCVSESSLIGRGQYERAAFVFADALRIREATLSPEHPAVADSLNDLASMSLERGDFRRTRAVVQAGARHSAEGVGEQSHVRTWRRRRGAHALTAVVFEQHLARLYSRRGDYITAESHYKEVIEIRERISGRDHGTVATALANLGGVVLHLRAVPEGREGAPACARHPRQSLNGGLHPRSRLLRSGSVSTGGAAVPASAGY